MDLKKEAARAAFSLLKNGTAIGLGAGATIAWLAGYIREAIDQGLTLSVYTSSEETKLLLEKSGIQVAENSEADTLDQYFDSCDQLDHELNALKSGAGIHTSEKLLAAMAKEFILLGDEAKYVSAFDIKFPLVLEVLPQAHAFVQKKMADIFPAVSLQTRQSVDRNSYRKTINGNYLIDCYFKNWPDPQYAQLQAKSIPGVVEISLFYHMASKAIIAGQTATLLYEKIDKAISRIDLKR
jgi:ribose 5-phosphate isomerase A